MDRLEVIVYVEDADRIRKKLLKRCTACGHTMPSVACEDAEGCPLLAAYVDVPAPLPVYQRALKIRSQGT